MGWVDAVHKLLTGPSETKSLQDEIVSLKVQLISRDEDLAAARLTIEGQSLFRSEVESEIQRLQDMSIKDHTRIAALQSEVTQLKLREQPIREFALKLVEAVAKIDEAVAFLPDELKPEYKLPEYQPPEPSHSDEDRYHLDGHNA